MNSEHNLILQKWICSSFITLFSMFGCLIPMIIRSKRWIFRLDSFSGGILFATGFVQLLEDATKDIFQYGKTPYPVSGTTAVSTFSMLTIILVFLGIEKVENLGDEKKEKEMSSLDENEDEANQHVDEGEGDEKVNKSLPVMTVIVYLIFAMNAVLEGIKIGIFKSKKDFVSFTSLVLVRKTFESYLLGLMMINSNINKYIYFTLMMLYSLLFIIGTVFSVFLKITKNNLIFGILISVASGTFVFKGVSKWAVMFLNKRNWSYADKFWNLGLFSCALLMIIIVAILDK